MKFVKLTLTIFLFNVLVLKSFAQEAIAAAGGSASGSSGTVSYTVGEVCNASNVGPGGTIKEGIQIPFEIWTITDVKKIKDIDLHYSAYPNPVSAILTLKVRNQDFKNFSLKLYSFSGNLLLEKKIEGNETTVSMDRFAPSVYFVRIFDSNNEIKVFKVIKN